MTFDELVARAASEPNRVVEVGTAAERRPQQTGHVFGAPIDPTRLEAWSRQWPQHPLPEDLQDLLRRANGIHLWADLDTGRAYEGLAPLEEWDLARRTMWGVDASPDMLGDEYRVTASIHVGRDAGYALIDTSRLHQMFCLSITRDGDRSTVTPKLIGVIFVD
jgi:hypothetical protein